MKENTCDYPPHFPFVLTLKVGSLRFGQPERFVQQNLFPPKSQDDNRLPRRSRKKSDNHPYYGSLGVSLVRGGFVATREPTPSQRTMTPTPRTFCPLVQVENGTGNTNLQETFRRYRKFRTPVILERRRIGFGRSRS